MLVPALRGARRGPLRALGSLVLLLVAVEAASGLGPALEHPVAQITGADPAQRGAAGWTAALLACLLLAGVLATACAPAAPPPSRSGRWGGGLIGTLRGVLLLAIAAHLLTDAGLLARHPGPAGAPSRGVVALEPLREPLARALRLPGPPDDPAATVGR